MKRAGPCPAFFTRLRTEPPIRPRLPMSVSAFNYRQATKADLAAMNTVIESAVMTWDLPDRLKRLALPSYRYGEHDFDHLEFRVAEDLDAGIVGVASWEPATSGDAPEGKLGLLLHGLYVTPGSQGRGIGRRLLAMAKEAAEQGGYDGLLVKAHSSAEAFFAASGLAKLPVTEPARHYPHRFWLAVEPSPSEPG